MVKQQLLLLFATKITSQVCAKFIQQTAVLLLLLTYYDVYDCLVYSSNTSYDVREIDVDTHIIILYTAVHMFISRGRRARRQRRI